MNFIIKTCICLGTFFLAEINGMEADNFPWTPPKNFVLQPKYIALHHPVATESILGQLYFDQGLTFIYAFNHDAAYWSFLRASEVDPNMAMAYWGMALSIGSNINMSITEQRGKIAHDLIQKAMQKVKNGPDVEKDYIQALSQRYSGDLNADEKTLDKQYRHAAVLYAESLLDVSPWNQWTSDGKPLPGTMKAVDVLRSVLARMPDHLGANHFYIHAVEASHHPEGALISAERLESLLPSSGHILHMPSHIYVLVGDYEKAVMSNQAAVAADREYIREFGMSGIYPLHYLSHNLFFLSRSYTLQGRYNEALNAANELVDFYSSNFQKMKELEYYASAPLSVLITFHRWNEILDLPAPNENMQTITALWHFARAMAYANLGKLSEAKREQQEFFNKKNRIGESEVFGYNKVSLVLTIAEYSLTAAIARSQGAYDEAVDALKRAVAAQDSLNYNEPPDWFYPVRETLGGLLLSMQRYSEAENVFREELIRHPNSGRALFGLRESLRGQYKLVDSYWTNIEFQKAWQNSTIPLTIQDL